MSSASAGDAATSAPSPNNQSIIARMVGVVRRPRSTFEAVAGAPRWTAPLMLLFLLPFGAAAAFSSTDVGRQALVDQWERTALAFGQPVDDGRYAVFQDLSQRGTAYAALTALVGGPGAALGLSALLFIVFTSALGGKATYRQVLAIVAHAGVILVLRELIATPVHYARESLASPTTLVRFFTMVDEASPVARFFGMIDVFVVWWLMVLAVGMAVLYDRRARMLTVTFVAVYVGAALVLAGTMAALGGTS